MYLSAIHAISYKKGIFDILDQENDPSKIHARYITFFNDQQLQRFTFLKERARRQKQILKDTNSDIKKMRRAAIGRMRRDNDKT